MKVLLVLAATLPLAAETLGDNPRIREPYTVPMGLPNVSGNHYFTLRGEDSREALAGIGKILKVYGCTLKYSRTYESVRKGKRETFSSYYCSFDPDKEREGVQFLKNLSNLAEYRLDRAVPYPEFIEIDGEFEALRKEYEENRAQLLKLPVAASLAEEKLARYERHLKFRENALRPRVSIIFRMDTHREGTGIGGGS